MTSVMRTLITACLLLLPIVAQAQESVPDMLQAENQNVFSIIGSRAESLWVKFIEPLLISNEVQKNPRDILPPNSVALLVEWLNSGSSPKAFELSKHEVKIGEEPAVVYVIRDTNGAWASCKLNDKWKIYPGSVATNGTISVDLTRPAKIEELAQLRTSFSPDSSWTYTTLSRMVKNVRLKLVSPKK